MTRKSQAMHDMRIRLVLWIIFLSIGLLVFFCFRPFLWKKDSHIAPGAPITLDAVSDFLIVADYSEFASNPETFSDMAFSQAWLNTFQQEIGPVSLLEAKAFASADLARFRCIILTKSVSGQSAWTPKIRSFLERGGIVVMEMPMGELREIASADGKGGIRTTQNITYMRDLASNWSESLTALNLSNITRLVGSAGPLEDSQTYMTIDGVPVVYTKNYAAGKVITVDFDYGMLLTSIQQGRPLDDFDVRSTRDTAAVETSDLAIPELPTAPIADILERYIVWHVIGEAMPVAGFWPFFDGLDGALIVSHREDGTGDASIWMSSYEATFKGTSTLFVLSPAALSDEGLDILSSNHSEIGLMFDLTPGKTDRATEPIGPFRFSPIWRQYNVEEQASGLRTRLDEHTPLISSQTRHGLWLPNYTRTFEFLAAADFRADASYRAPIEQPGYAFGTGLPFMPVDTNGHVFNILEFPVLFPDIRNQEDASLIDSMLKESAEQAHEAIGVSFDPNAFTRHPDVNAFISWQAVYQSAAANKHWITGILSFFRFSRARFTAELQSSVSTVQNSHKTYTVLRLKTLAPETGMTVSVPAKIDGKAFIEARRGIQRIREDALLTDTIQTRPVSVFGFERVLVPLAKGFNAIDIIYEQ